MWGHYLARGVRGQEKGGYDLSAIITGCDTSFSDRLLKHGYAVVHFNNLVGFSDDSQFLDVWHEVFSASFDLSSDDKNYLGPYRMEKGATIGYRIEQEREFLETRIGGNGAVEPAVDVMNFSQTVAGLHRIFTAISTAVLSCVSTEMGLDPRYFLDLTDRGHPGEDEWSSSVLRICHYPNTSSGRSVLFGAHTDTSFVTIAPLSRVSGLEVLDLNDGVWHCPETIPGEHCSNSSSSSGSGNTSAVVVIVGECLQLLTRSRYRAAIHRVAVSPNVARVSCPFLVRGRPKAVVGGRTYHHPGGACAVQSLPDLQGISMKMLHLLLDRKRGRCAAAHQHDDDDGDGNADGEQDEREWVLCAFPESYGHLLP
eukprot:gene3832-7635_t